METILLDAGTVLRFEYNNFIEVLNNNSDLETREQIILMAVAKEWNRLIEHIAGYLTPDERSSHA